MWVKNLAHVYTLGKNFPIIFFSLRYWMGQHLSSCFKHFSPPETFWLPLTLARIAQHYVPNGIFFAGFIQFQNKTSASSTIPLCIWLLFLLCFFLCFPSTISSNMFRICVVVYIWDNHTWNQQYLLYLKNICLDAMPNFGTWHIKLSRKNASLGKMK